MVTAQEAEWTLTWDEFSDPVRWSFCRDVLQNRGVGGATVARPPLLRISI